MTRFLSQSEACASTEDVHAIIRCARGCCTETAPVYQSIDSASNARNRGRQLSAVGRPSSNDSAQIRKDLSYFGRFGKQGRGYNIQFLLKELRDILGLTHEWRACLVGVGRLGRAIINYTGFAPEGFKIVAAFDSNDDQVGTDVGDIKVLPMSDLADVISKQNVAIGIVAVPAIQAQPVIDILVKGGVRGILNCAPVAPQVPLGIVMRNIDPVLSLQSMTFYLKDD